jgi:hypothetical protein
MRMTISYRSKLEFLIAQALKAHGIKFEYENITIPYEQTVRSGICKSCGAVGKHVQQRHTYTPDFVLAKDFVLEGKGILTAGERAKFLAIKKAHPELTIAFVFGSDNKLNKQDATIRYSTWCKQHGFDFGIKELPESVVRAFGRGS